MAEIPPDLASSAAQAPVQAREALKEQAARRAGQAHAANRHIRAVDESGVIVETGDSDNQVFADAEGTGSQGRQPSDDESPAAAADTDPPDADRGITRDADGQLHLDLEA